MGNYQTRFGSIDAFDKGGVDVIKDDPKNYAFSNVYEVAATSAAYERVCVAKNFEYVIEATRAEGISPWYEHAHDEFVVNMEDVEVVVELVKLDNTDHIDPDLEGARLVDGDPTGKFMGRLFLARGHMGLLPEGAAYRFVSDKPATLILQSIDGAVTQHRWSNICQK